MINANKKQGESGLNKSSKQASRVFSESKFSKYTSRECSRKLTINTESNEQKGWSFLEARKESQLNSLFNIRKQRLNHITKANLVIYEKINTQSSHYGTRFHTRGEEGSRDRFKTVENSRQDERMRNILGPIGNFLPLTTSNNCNYDLQVIERRLKAAPALQKPKKKGKNSSPKNSFGLPNLFTFY